MAICSAYVRGKGICALFFAPDLRADGGFVIFLLKREYN